MEKNLLDYSVDEINDLEVALSIIEKQRLLIEEIKDASNKNSEALYEQGQNAVSLLKDSASIADALITSNDFLIKRNDNLVEIISGIFISKADNIDSLLSEIKEKYLEIKLGEEV